MSSSDPVDLKTVHVPYRETVRRLDELARRMPTGVTVNLDDATALAIKAAIERVERGTR